MKILMTVAMLIFLSLMTACNLFLSPMKERDDKSIAPYCYQQIDFEVLHDGYVNNASIKNFDYAELVLNSGGNEECLIEFDLSEIPEDATILSAELWLNCNDVITDGGFSGYPVIQNWNITSSLTASLDPVNFYNGSNELFYQSVTTPADDGVSFGFDIRGLVQDWVTDTPNYGIVLKAGTGSLNFYSSESYQGPILKVEYEYYGSDSWDITND